jgi:hypothetical protein
MNFYSYEYEYKDRNNVSHTGGGDGDFPSFFVEDLRKGETTTINMKCRIRPILNGRLIMDTIEWKPTVAVNISNEAIPALFLKSPAAGVAIYTPAKFEWTMTEEINDYTFKLSRNAGFPPEETFSVDVGNIGEYELDTVTNNELVARYGVRGLNYYWTVVPTTSNSNVRTQSRQVKVLGGPDTVKYDETEWTIEVSSAHTEGGGKDKVIDDNYSNSGYWHSMYSPNAALPHWAVIDMKVPLKVSKIVTQRRSNGDNKTLQYFVGDSPNASADTWVQVAEGVYESKTANHTLTLDVTEFVTGRYLKLVIPDSFRVPFSGICEIDVY